MEGESSRSRDPRDRGVDILASPVEQRRFLASVEGFTRSLAARAPGTRRTYTAGARRFAAFSDADEPSCLEQFYLEMTFDGVPASTRAVYSAAAVAFIRWLIADGQLPADWNLVAATERLKAVKTKGTYAVRHIGDEADLLLTGARGAPPAPRKELPKLRYYRDLAIIHVLYDTGARRAEIASMKRSELDLRARQARVLGKGNKERTVFFTPAAQDALTAYLERRDDDTDAVFLTHPGDREIRPAVIRDAVKRFEKLAGVECRPHTFRHAFARRKLKQGLDMNQIAALLGHSSVTTTASIYAPYDTEQLQAAYDEGEKNGKG